MLLCIHHWSHHGQSPEIRMPDHLESKKHGIRPLAITFKRSPSRRNCRILRKKPSSTFFTLNPKTLCNSKSPPNCTSTGTIGTTWNTGCGSIRTNYRRSTSIRWTSLIRILSPVRSRSMTRTRCGTLPPTRLSSSMPTCWRSQDRQLPLLRRR